MTHAMKIALLQPPAAEIRQQHDASAYPSLALGYLSAFLHQQGYEKLLVVDARLEGIPLDKAMEDIIAFQPDLIGITARTPDILQAAEAARRIKEACPKCVTLIGGCHFMALPEATMREFPMFDFGIHGEGEYPLLELCQALTEGSNPTAIQNLVWRDGDAIRQNEVRPAIEDLDALPHPAWHLFRKRRHSYMIYGSRGCPFNCNFCQRALGKKPRLRSPENIMEEIDYLVKEFECRFVDFEDETFALRPEHAFRVCELMIERGYHQTVKWTANMRANLVTEPLLARMKEAGCYMVAIGVESGNADILKASGKGVTIPEIETAFQICKKVGMQSTALFILGHPNETKATAHDTIRLARRLNPTHLSMGIMVPYPGTEIRNIAERGEGGYHLLDVGWDAYQKYLGNALELEHLSRRQLEILQMKAYLHLYIGNGRFLDLARLVRQHLRGIWNLVKKLLHGS